MEINTHKHGSPRANDLASLLAEGNALVYSTMRGGLVGFVTSSDAQLASDDFIINLMRIKVDGADMQLMAPCGLSCDEARSAMFLMLRCSHWILDVRRIMREHAAAQDELDVNELCARYGIGGDFNAPAH